LVGDSPVDAIEDSVTLEEKIQRCRRIASGLTDPDMREALEDLARQYEAELKGRGGRFMLRPGAGS